MAATRAKKQQPVGSAAWIAAEKENIAQLVDQEMEEIEFPVRHEMEWLNEHMAEIFSTNQFNVTEIFKTPGKLRGKTPRTARKRNVLESRVPLSDIFSVNQNKQAKLPPENRFNEEIAKITAADNAKPAPPPTSQNVNSQPKYNTDSGYHGMTDDEMDMVVPEPSAPETATQPLEEPTNDRQRISPSVDRRTTEGSFHSAQEAPVNTDVSGDAMAIDHSEAGDEPTLHAQEPTPKALRKSNDGDREAPKQQEAAQDQPRPNAPQTEDHSMDIALDHHFDDIGSPSDGSTPDRPLIRKSSLSFASLPAREPLTTKKSMGGGRMSRTSHVDQSKLNLAGRSSYFGRQTGGSRLAHGPLESNDDMMEVDEHMDIDEDMTITRAQENSSETRASKLHNKSSTQRLHERITMLGKSQPPRPTKSIPAVTAMSGTTQVAYPELPSSKPDSMEDRRSKTPMSHPVADDDDDDDEWIKKPGSPMRTQRPQLTKSHTTDVMEQFQGNSTIGALEGQDTGNPKAVQDSGKKQSPTPETSYQPGSGHVKSSSTSVLTPPPPGDSKMASASNVQVESTTPTTSPKRYDGPLSASKSKLQSIMKTAKGLFTSSAGVSAAAKMETFSPTGNRSQHSLYPSISGMLGAQESQQSLSSRPGTPSRQGSPVRQGSPIRLGSPLRQTSPSRQPERVTRGSMEREEKRKEKELKDRQRVDAQLEKAREKERQKASQFKDNDPPALERIDRVVAPAPPPATRTSPRKAQQPQNAPAREVEGEEPKFAVPNLPQPQTQKQNESRRPAKPTREAAQKPKPQPVSIRVGTLSQRIPMSSTTSLSSSVQEQNPPPAATKQPTIGKKASNSSLQTGNSANNFKSSTSKPKALLAAERKKEQDEREAQRKLEQRRDMERKRAAQEDARRQNQKSRAETEAERRERERERAASEDPKKLTQKQAIEKRRLENARKLEQQRNQQATPANDTDSMPPHERQAPPPSNRGDAGPGRPPSRMNSIQPPSRPPPNPAKPPKRALEEESTARAMVSKNGVTSQQADSKRRKTEDEFNPEPPYRPTMAPPIRQSNIRKETVKPPTYTHGYTAVPPQQSQAGPSSYKHPGQPSQHMHHQASMQSMQPPRQAPPVEMAKYASGKIPFAEPPNAPHPSHKTPGTGKKQKVAKSSPHYPNGDQIKLPEIPTDSEDEDSDDNPFPVPEWAQDDQLRRLLEEQDGKDGDQVFGPIAPLHMEEIFTGKDRAKRFRDRTSSANWAGPDGLTRDEVKKDLAAREKMRENGGWTFGL